MHGDEMTTAKDVNMDQIIRDAHRLRAETTAAGARRFARWVSGLVSVAAHASAR